jgi:nitrite reductase (NADH) large subunit
MLGGNVLYEGTVVSNTLKVVGIDLTASGDIDAEGKLECVVKSNREKNLYRKVTFKEDKIVGCVLLGNIKGNFEILNAIEKQVNVKDLKNLILEDDFDFKKLK